MGIIVFLAMAVIDWFFALVIYRSWIEFGFKRQKIPMMSNYDTYVTAYSSVINTEAKDDVLLTEYERTQEMLTHYDNLNWQIGSILVGSNIVALGFLSSQSNVQILFAAALGGSFSLFAWILWFLRHASIYGVKSDRLYMIEMKLGMVQHRMVGAAKNANWLTSVAGNKVAVFLFAGLIAAWLAVLL